MKRIALTLIAVAGLALAACSDGTSDSLSNGRSGQAPATPTAPPATRTPRSITRTTPVARLPEPTSSRRSPARSSWSARPRSRRACTRAARSRSRRSATSSRAAASPAAERVRQARSSGQAIFTQGATAAAFGGANYNGRVPEAPFASTSAMAKMFDIFTMASYDAVSAELDRSGLPGREGPRRRRQVHPGRSHLPHGQDGACRASRDRERRHRQEPHRRRQDRHCCAALRRAHLPVRSPSHGRPAIERAPWPGTP